MQKEISSFLCGQVDIFVEEADEQIPSLNQSIVFLSKTFRIHETTQPIGSVP
jgi:hypothetical protein